MITSKAYKGNPETSFRKFRQSAEWYGDCLRCEEFAFLIDGICGSCADDLREEHKASGE